MDIAAGRHYQSKPQTAFNVQENLEIAAERPEIHPSKLLTSLSGRPMAQLVDDYYGGDVVDGLLDKHYKAINKALEKMDEDKKFYEAKLTTARFFMMRQLPECIGLLAKLAAGSKPLMMARF